MIFLFFLFNPTIHIEQVCIIIMKYEHTSEDKEILAKIAMEQGISKTRFATQFGLPFYEADILYRRIEGEL